MVTISDIAKATGVSAGTVSKVISQSEEFGRISPATVNKIRHMVREMGYRPNVNAQALVSRKSMTLGVYIAPHPGGRIDPLYVSPILEGICQTAREVSYDVLLIDFGNTDQDLRQSMEKFMTKRVDGVILIYYHGSSEIIESLSAVGMPVVAVNNFKALSLNSVNLDNSAGVGLVMQHLYDLGHRKIAFLGELCEPLMVDHTLRQEAFVQTARRLGIDDVCLVCDASQIGIQIPREGPFCQEDGYHGADWLLKNKRSFTALVCYNDVVAMGVLRRLSAAGLRVPEDVSITGFDNSFISAYLTPPLTTVEHPTRQMGTQAAKTLLEIISDPSAASAKTIMFEPELVIRASTGTAQG
jgi:LacI family transcriptional regulator